mmetsp:Transcript_20087/g.46283  ORF Transcript_20087/g.46283 Transcript_20087/m.46283 type:complete len:271 (-) Transcript_20087:145-957(-)
MVAATTDGAAATHTFDTWITHTGPQLHVSRGSRAPLEGLVSSEGPPRGSCLPDPGVLDALNLLEKGDGIPVCQAPRPHHPHAAIPLLVITMILLLRFFFASEVKVHLECSRQTHQLLRPDIPLLTLRPAKHPRRQPWIGDPLLLPLAERPRLGQRGVLPGLGPPGRRRRPPPRAREGAPEVEGRGVPHVEGAPRLAAHHLDRTPPRPPLNHRRHEPLPVEVRVGAAARQHALGQHALGPRPRIRTAPAAGRAAGPFGDGRHGRRGVASPG